MKSKLNKCLKHIQGTTEFKQEIIRNLTVGGEYFSGWRIEKLKESDNLIKKTENEKKKYIENELYAPLEYQLKRNKKIARRMERGNGEKLEDDYRILDEADSAFNKTFMDVSSYYDSFLDSNEKNRGKYEKSWRDFAKYTFKGINPILKQYDEMIAETKEIRKKYKKTNRIDVNALRGIIEKNISVSKIYRDFSKDLNEKYQEPTKEFKETYETLLSTFSETAENIRNRYQNDDFQDAIRNISWLSEYGYPSTGEYMLKRAKGIVWSLEDKFKDSATKIKERFSKFKNRNK